MSGQGYHFAVGKGQMEALLACPDEQAVLDITDRLVDGFNAGGEGCGGEKGWDVLHRCLSDGTLDPAGGTPPLNRCFLGGRLLVTDGSIVNFVTPEEVREAAPAFARLDGAWLRRRFVDLFGPEYSGPIPEEDFQRFGDLFEELKGFYLQSAAEGKAVVFVTDEGLDELRDRG
jgi:hypothetical protein